MIDSSPSSAESSFRELDEVFLQTQTRIWLGEVVNTILGEDLHLSDLLQDGEILFEVSKVVWNLLLTKCMELKHLKHKYSPFGSRRSSVSGRYRPYSNVDSFIKICKILGLNGIDLFSPSDVVEKRNIRKVCICIRALSKKARSKQLSVPDFDMVIYSVAMPKNMVGVIRKSLESSSQSTLSSSSGYSSRKVSQMKLKQKSLSAQSNGDGDYSSSEESDEAESRYMGGVNSDLENSPEGRCIEEFKHEHCKSASLSETVQSISQQHLENDRHELDKMSFCGGISNVNNDARRHNLGNVLENDYSVVGDSSCVNDDGESNNYISDYLAFSDLMVHATEGSNSVIGDEENNMFDFFLDVDSQGRTSNSNRRSFRNGTHRKYSDDEDMEVSSTTSMSSVLGRLLNLEFDEDDDSSELPKVDTNYQTVAFDSGEAHQSEMEPTVLSAFSLPYRNKCDDTSSAVVDSQDNNINISCGAGAGNGSQQEEDNGYGIMRRVVKGTAIAAGGVVLFMLLHISRKSKGNNNNNNNNNNNGQEKKQYDDYDGGQGRQKKAAAATPGKGIYPAEKLKL